MKSFTTTTICLVVLPLAVDSFFVVNTPKCTPTPTNNKCFLQQRGQVSLHNKCKSTSTWGIQQPQYNGLYMTADDNDDDLFVNAQDSEALQNLFSKQCDKGLMTKDELKQVPLIADLLEEGDLLTDEFNDIWDAAPKFPDVTQERIDVDSFIQIYRDIDDLFEEEDDTEISTAGGTGSSSTDDKTSSSSPASPSSLAVEDEDDDDVDETTAQDEQELEAVYKTICDKDGLISREELKAWDEVEKLIEEGLLGEDEFADIWEKTLKSPGAVDRLDVDGFLSFNVAVDDLFVFDDDEEEENMEDLEIDIPEIKNDESSDTAAAAAPPQALTMISGEDLPPGVIFAELCDANQLVGKDDLNRWGELQEMLADGDLLPLELQNIYDGIPKTTTTTGGDKLDEVGFIALYEAIDALFEDDDDDDEEDEATSSSDMETSSTVKTELLEILEDLNNDDERLPCGLECSEGEQDLIIKIVNVLESENSNLILQKAGNIELEDLAGTWELMFSSSSAMKFNKGLSGLGGSFPSGKFGGLKQVLKSNKYLTDMEYIERIAVTPDTASFDVRVNGDWELEQQMSLFTGEPSTVVRVVPERVTYGPTSTRADHWKSLGPLNSLDVAYLDDDLRIMRGNTATENVFIFKKSTS